MDVKQHKDEISEIQNKATREHELSEAFEKVKHEWAGKPIELTHPKDRDDFYILSGPNVEEIRELLEDSMVKISNISNARYVDLIREKVEKFFKELAALDNLISEFLDC
jgi:hypothetical protein